MIFSWHLFLLTFSYLANRIHPVYYKPCTRVFPAPQKLAQSTSQYHFVLQSLHKDAQSTSQCYFVLQSLHKVLPSTTSYFKACTKTSTHCLANHARTASNYPAMTSMDAAIPVQPASLDRQTQWHNTVNRLMNLLQINFTVGNASEMKRAKTGPVAKTRFHTSPPGNTLCKKDRASCDS